MENKHIRTGAVIAAVILGLGAAISGRFDYSADHRISDLDIGRRDFG